MGKRAPNIMIDRNYPNSNGYIRITLDRPDKAKLKEVYFDISPNLLNRIYKELGILTDTGALNRMEEIVEWLAEREEKEVFIEKGLVIKY